MKKINLIDLSLLLTILLSISGFILAKAEKVQLNKAFEGQENISIEVLIPDVYSKENNYFKTGDKCGITIRNRPYTKLLVTMVESKPKQVLIPSFNGSYKTINDPTKVEIKDYFVTLTDLAFKTKEGYVIGGIKIKSGNPVELEGFNYRLNGKIISISTNPTDKNGKQ